MPTSLPYLYQPQPTQSSAPLARRLCWLTIAAVLILGVAPAPCSSQTLAHPGLAGNGLRTDAWWQHAVFYKIAPSAAVAGGDHGKPAPSATDYKMISAKLNALRSLGVDALLVPMPPMPAQVSTPDSTLDAFDQLMQRASGQGLRVLISLTASSATPDLPALARFWLAHGVAGFRVETPPETSPQDVQAIMQTLRKITSSAVGQRIVLSNIDTAKLDTLAPASSPRPGSAARRTDRSVDASGAQLQIDSRVSQISVLEAIPLRALLVQLIDRAQAGPGVLLDFAPVVPQAGANRAVAALDKAIAAAVITALPAALIDADDELLLKMDAPPALAPVAQAPAAIPGATFTLAVPPVRPQTPPAPTPEMVAATSLTDWYRQLIALHHGNPTVRYGTATMLNFDAQNALVWVSRPATNSALTAPVVVACNLSSAPVVLSLTSAMRDLNLHGSFLRTLLRSGKGMGGQNLSAVTLEPFGVYVGELRR